MNEDEATDKNNNNPKYTIKEAEGTEVEWLLKELNAEVSEYKILTSKLEGHVCISHKALSACWQIKTLISINTKHILENNCHCRH